MIIIHQSVGKSSFDYEIVQSCHNNDILINLKINNSDERSNYPFATIIIKNISVGEAKIETDSILNKTKSWSHDALFKRIKALSYKYGVSIVKRYETETYDELINEFPYDFSYYNVLCVIDGLETDKTKTTHDILILPFRSYGSETFQPIRKSPNFSLYNGKLISTKHNTTVYIMVDILVSFSFEVAFGINDVIEVHTYTFYVDPRNKREFYCDKKLISIPKYGREFLLHPKRRNLFPLKSVPDNIIIRKNGTIEVKNGK